MLNGGGYGKQHLFSRSVISQFTEPSKTNPTYGLGWRLNGNTDMEWMFGKHASNKAYGHTGWTGTVTIIDPVYQIGIVLLTNKKHSPVINPKETRINLKVTHLQPESTAASLQLFTRRYITNRRRPLYEKISSMRVDCIAVIVSRFAARRSRSRSETAAGTTPQTNGQQHVA